MNDDFFAGLFIIGFFGVFAGVLACFMAETNLYLDWLIPMIIFTIVVSEILFFSWDEKKPKKNQSVFWFTAERKLTYLIPMALFVGTYVGWVMIFMIVIKETIEKTDWNAVLVGLGYTSVLILSEDCATAGTACARDRERRSLSSARRPRCPRCAAAGCWQRILPGSRS